MAYVPSEDSDQPGHTSSLIIVFAVRMKKAWVLSYPMSAERRLIRLGRCPGWSESLLGAHTILLVLLWGSLFMSYSPAKWCVPREDSDQPAHLPSLTRVLAGHSGQPRTLSFLMQTVKTLIRLHGCAGWYKPSLCAHHFVASPAPWLNF